MKLAELRALLEGAPDDAEVIVQVSASHLGDAAGVDVRGGGLYDEDEDEPPVFELGIILTAEDERTIGLRRRGPR